MTLKIYRYLSLGMSIIFGLVGILFLTVSDGVVNIFNRLSEVIGMAQTAPGGGHFYVILSVAYMYAVALIAFLMYRNPKDAAFPFLLFNAKIASSLVSILLFVADRWILIYITNGIVDGLIAMLVIAMYRNSKKGFV